MDRRMVIAGLGTAAVLPSMAVPASARPTTFALPPLPYAPDALEPVVDVATMRLHHGQHHQIYVDNLNKAVAGNARLLARPLDSLVRAAKTLPAAVRDNAGGHWNHDFFWRAMTPPGKGGEPSPALGAALTRDFGGMDAMKTAFREAGTARFGSGWVWLTRTAAGRLAIVSTPNQDNPLMDAGEAAPILGNDVWEHAYYLKHRNRRADYLNGWWDVVDWPGASRRFAAAPGRG